MVDITKNSNEFAEPSGGPEQNSSDSMGRTQPIRNPRYARVRKPSSAFDHRAAATQPVHIAQLPKATPAGSIARGQTRPTHLFSSHSLWSEFLRRLLRNPEAIIGMVIIALFLLVSIFAPWIVPHSLDEIKFGQDNLPPAWVQRSNAGLSGNPDYLLGTDRRGRDLLSWGIMGTRTSMLLGVISAPLIALFGMVVGVVAGYYGGKVDNWIMRVTDVFYAFPPLVICIMVVLALRETPVGLAFNGLLMFFLAFLSVSWTGAARLVRSSVLSEKNAEYITAAECIGVPARRMIFKHLLPSSLAPLIVWVTLLVPQLILTEAIFGYLQINIGPAYYPGRLTDMSWGGMISSGRSLIHIQPWTILIPAIGVGLITIAFTFLGDAMRDALDPKSIRR